MPNWSDDEGRYYWVPENQPWYNSVEIPHPPVVLPRKGCKCTACLYTRNPRKKKKEIPKKVDMILTSKKLSEEEVLRNTEIVMKLVDLMPDPRKDLVKKMLDGPVGQHYFSAPASSREDFHYCFPGGLVAHSLNVVKYLRSLSKALAPDRYPDHQLAFVGLFHDLGKAGDGINEYYVPNPSEWHRNKGMLYETNKACAYMPTSERGLYLLQKNGIELSSEEYLAIRLNDGQYDDTNKNYRMKEPELALLVHFADRWSSEKEKH